MLRREGSTCTVYQFFTGTGTPLPVHKEHPEQNSVRLQGRGTVRRWCEQGEGTTIVMSNFRLALAAIGLGFAVLFAPQSAATVSADSPYAGVWNVSMAEGNEMLSVLVIKIEDSGGSLRGKVLSAGLPMLKGCTLAGVRGGPRLGVDLKMPDGAIALVAGPAAEDKSNPKRLLGSMTTGDRRILVVLDQTDRKELSTDPTRNRVGSTATTALERARNIADAKTRAGAVKEFLTTYRGSPLTYIAAAQVLVDSIVTNAPEREVRSAAEKFIEIAAAYGPEMKWQATVEAAANCANSNRLDLAGLAVQYSREAERELTKDATYSDRSLALRTLATTLRLSGQTEEAKEIDTRLDRDFARENIPFAPQVYPGRTAKSGRSVVLELFTGAQCGPCVAADIAFDAARKTYRHKDVILIQYHLNVPGPDPLTNAETEKRASFYHVEGTPTALLDGKATRPVGGPRLLAKRSYDVFRSVIEKELEKPAGANVTLTAVGDADAIEIHAEVANLHKTGKQVRLRLVLVEEMVHYVAPNGQRYHQYVVRSFPSGQDGYPLKEKSARKKVTVDLRGLRRTLEENLTNFKSKFKPLHEDPSLQLKHLKVLALVQDDGTKEILNAAQIDVEEEMPRQNGRLRQF
jgi:hypothetical protein